MSNSFLKKNLNAMSRQVYTTQIDHTLFNYYGRLASMPKDFDIRKRIKGDLIELSRLARLAKSIDTDRVRAYETLLNAISRAFLAMEDMGGMPDIY